MITENIIVDVVASIQLHNYPSNCQYKLLQMCAEYGGYGLQSLEIIKPGEFIIEYTGELINYWRKRLRPYQKYTIDLFTDFHSCYLDSTYCGNIARYINHSCDPNCEMHILFKKGLSTACIYAINIIDKEEFIHFDYFEGTSTFGISFLDNKCLCNSPYCRFKM